MESLDACEDKTHKLVQPSLSQHDRYTTRAEPESANTASHPGFHYNALLHSNDMMRSGSVACSAAAVSKGSVSTGPTMVSAESLKIPALLTRETVNLVV